MRLLTIALLIFLSSYVKAQESVKDIFVKATETMRSHKSLSYTVTLRMKYAQTNDTVTHSSIVHMLRNERDTMMGGMVWQSNGINDPQHYSFYDLDMRYIVMHPQRKAWKEKMEYSNMGLRSPSQHLLFETFLHPDKLLKYPFEKMEVLKDTVIDRQACYTVKTRQATEIDNIGPIDQTWYFSKKDMFPLLKVTVVKIDGNDQYDELRYVSHEYDKITEEQFSPKQIPADYLVASRPPNVVIDTRDKK